jgi:zinc transport system substrate-binding protein
MKKILQSIKCYNITIQVICGFALMAIIPSAWASDAKRPQVITSIKPLAIIAQSALGNSASVDFILPPGQSPHDAVPTISAVKKLNSADKIVWIGSNFEVRASKQISSFPDSKLITGIELLPHNKTTSHQDSHAHYETDPHIWLSPSMANQIAKSLQQSFELPVQDIFTKNDYEKIATLLAPAKNNHFISHHDAIGYFIEAFDLMPPLSIRDGTGEKQGIKTQLRLRQQAQELNARCILVEPQHGHKDAMRIAKDLNLPLVEFDIQGLDQPLKQMTYVSYIEAITNQLLTCFK